ncbi:hypothetical protein [Catenuloplanes indicus]|uniref:Uncharacterized protein n=1 Tax=Catenuloplanes indicus TaxID=137267 RepID=A0AAE4AVB3_9ACTN|nr:hypothetical protein [Catenuloplanes indicus]MDQ0363769.1 hypothetical protein [Catenuloplanes indicus]
MAHEDDAGLVSDRFPRFAAELADALRAAGEGRLADQVAGLRVVQECGCDDDFCRSFYTAPPPDGAYGPGHRCVTPTPERAGMFVLDVVDDEIMYVEALTRARLD